MNGTAAPEDRLTRKRALESELEAIRIQKAEVLKAIQQIAKKQKLGGPPSKNVALTHEAKVEAEKRNHQEQLRRIWGMCTKVVTEMMKNTNVRLYFGEPVHRDKFPGYYETIKKPRDLGTIKAWIETGHYQNIRGFRDDVRLCFDNCRLYNPVGHQVRKFGDGASDQFEKKWENRKVEEEWDAEMERHRLTMARLEAEAKSLPDKIKEVEAELQDLAAKAVARNQAPTPGPGREMTFEEKRKLSHMLGSLPGERLARVLEIVAAGPSADTLEGDEECEFDIDALDAGTLWKLQAYVDSVATEIDNKAARPGAGVAVPADDTPMGDAAPIGAAAATAAAGGGAGGAPAGGDNATSEEVGSKGNADSTGADPTKSNYSNNPAIDIDIEGGGGEGGRGAQEQEREKDGKGRGPAAPQPTAADVAMTEADAPPPPTATITTATDAANKNTTPTTEPEIIKEPSAAPPPAPPAEEAARGHDISTFVSATGPGAQPQILRNTTQKKDVQIQNAGAWENLQEAPQGGNGDAKADGGNGGGGAAAADGRAVGENEAAPMEDDDNLWDEFKGREAQEQQAEAQKKALEEAEKKRQEEEAAAAAKAEKEAAAAEERRKLAEEEAKKKAEEEERAREAAELKNLTTKGAEDVAVEAMRQAGHGADITELGLVARQDEDDEDDLEI